MADEESVGLRAGAAPAVGGFGRYCLHTSSAPCPETLQTPPSPDLSLVRIQVVLLLVVGEPKMVANTSC